MKTLTNNAGLSVDTTGLATEAKQDEVIANQTDGTQKTQLVDAAGDVADVKALSTVPVSSEKGLITQSIIHGLNSGGGGTYVDVKVDPAGKLLVVANIDQTTPGTTNGVAVNSALPAGNNNIGDVDVASLPVAFNSGTVSATTQRMVLATDVALPSGDNNIGNVDVVTLPALPAGSNNIGDVDVLTLPSLPAGTNNIGDVDVLSVPANMSVNFNQLVGNTVSTGNGVVGTGVQRVAIASDNSIIPVYQTVSSASTNAATRVNSTAAEASRVLKASAGRLYILTITTSRTSDQYFQLFNSTTVPADSTAPIYTFKLPADSTVQIDFSSVGGIYFSTGIASSNSTTMATKTIGSADCFITAEIA
jgi:hypothetical protein